MASDDKTPDDPEAAFSFGVRELRSAKLAQKPNVDVAPNKVVNEDPGVDPYNTSGSFDRNAKWSRVGKR